MIVNRAFSLVLLCVLSACAGLKPYEPVDASRRTLFLPSVRTAAPEPVYARTRWVRAADVVPAREQYGATDQGKLGESPKLRSVFLLSLKNSSLEETARVLAAMARYSSFTAPSISSQKISVENVGTIDELARIIEGKARINVVVDHENKEVRFLAAHGEAPRLLDE